MTTEKILGVALIALVNYFVIRPHFKEGHVYVDLATALVVGFGVSMTFMSALSDQQFTAGLVLMEGLPMIAGAVMSMMSWLKSGSTKSGKPVSLDF